MTILHNDKQFIKGRMTLRGLFWPLLVIDISLLVQNGGKFENYMQRSPEAYWAMAPYQSCSA